MINDSPFVRKLHEKRISSSQSAASLLPLISPAAPISGTPMYECQAFEDYSVTFPYFVEYSGLSYYYLIYTSEGEGCLTYRGSSSILSEGSVALIDCAGKFRLEIHDCRLWSFRALYLTGPSLFHYYSSFSRNDSCCCHISPLSRIPAIIEDIHYMMGSGPAPGYEMNMSRYITDLLTECVHEMDMSCEKLIMVPKYLIDIKRELDSNFNNSFTLDDLAMLTNMSKYQLAHDFTKHFGIPPMKYLCSVRMDNAKKLLTSTDMSVSEVGSSVGIDNATQFIRLFRRSFGTTPKQYRRFAPMKL